MSLLVGLMVSACIAAPVSYKPASDPFAPPRLPWVRAGAVTGYLFYYTAPGPWSTKRDRAIIYTRGRGPNFSTKILWRVRRGWGWLTITGFRLDGEGHFRQRFKGTGSSFPSIVDVPTSGCWRITVSNTGRRASFAFVAVEPSVWSP